MRKLITVFILLILQELFLIAGLHAQEKKENVFIHPDKFYKKFFPHLKIKPTEVDTHYIKAYPKYLSLGTHVLLPKIYLDLNPGGLKGEGSHASSQLRTNINMLLAFSCSYRFVTAGFAIGLKSDPKNKEAYAQTRYRTATIKYNSPKYSLQFKYMKVKGLMDINEFNNQDSTRQYNTRPDLSMKEYHFEGVYNFTWKKYSYMAPIDFTQRQVKSRIGFMLKGGIYYNQLFSDSNLLSVRQRPYFEEFNNINMMKGYTIKLAPGIGANLVFMKKFYLASSIFAPYNIYFNRLYTSDNHLARNETRIQLVLDGMVSLGYQSRRFYASFRYQIDSKVTKLKYFSSTMVYGYMGLDVGYRFNAPTFVKKFYRKTMPPGM
jgi:hypothetical protein